MPLLSPPRGKESYGATIYRGDEIATLLTPATFRISPQQTGSGHWFGLISPVGQPPVVSGRSRHAVRVNQAIRTCCPDDLSVRARSDGHIAVLSEVPLFLDHIQEKLCSIVQAAMLWNIVEITVDSNLNSSA